MDADALVSKVEGLNRLLKVVAGRVPVDRLTTARAVVDRAGERLRLSRDHTVVALAGATGSGKSSLFNALSGLELSRVGYRRPTTAAAHACVWNPTGAAELLDWLGIPKRHQVARESVLDGESEAPLRGLVLLDLPDFDSVEVTHHLEVDRITGLADLLIWVLDPQKYADAVVHQRYLRGLTKYTEVTVVVLNQIDKLSPDDARRCLDDVRRLLDEDGLHEARLAGASAKTGSGVDGLRELLAKTVADRQATLQRLAGDVDTAVESVEHLVGPEIAEDAVDRAMVNTLATKLGDSAGVSAVASVAAATYESRGLRTTRWPIARWLARVRPDPLRRMAARVGAPLPTPNGGRHRHAAAEPSAAQRSQVDLAVRALGNQVSEGLPEPWPEAISAAGRTNVDMLPDELDSVISETDLGVYYTPFWWRLVNGMQWLFFTAAVLGGLWLLGRVTVAFLALPELPMPTVGIFPIPTIMLVAGVLLGLVTGALARRLIFIAARRFGERAERTLRAAVAAVARERVVAPIRTELAAYADARAALAAARGES
ncbi:MAG: ABC transporter [Micromonosporaceae bacterium]|nr:ABC transporter [Micromonosporaceae bacterium]